MGSDRGLCEYRDSRGAAERQAEREKLKRAKALMDKLSRVEKKVVEKKVEKVETKVVEKEVKARVVKAIPEEERQRRKAIGEYESDRAMWRRRGAKLAKIHAEETVGPMEKALKGTELERRILAKKAAWQVDRLREHASQLARDGKVEDALDIAGVIHQLRVEEKPISSEEMRRILYS